MLTENQEANFLKVLKGLRIHKANGTTHLRNREEAFTCVVDDTIEMIEKALTIPGRDRWSVVCSGKGMCLIAPPSFIIRHPSLGDAPTSAQQLFSGNVRGGPPRFDGFDGELDVYYMYIFSNSLTT